MNYEQILELISKGNRVARSWWRGTWVMQVETGNLDGSTEIRIFHEYPPEDPRYPAFHGETYNPDDDDEQATDWLVI
jgi:hypothetical protein